MAPSRIARSVLFVCAALLLSCAHVQQEGQYAFAATEIIRDTCGLLPAADALWDGSLQISGELVSMDYELFEIQLRGAFKEVSESFYMDGSAANVLATVRGEQCQLDLATVHLEAETESSTAFTGTLRVEYQARAQERCACEVWATYRAEKTGN